MSYDEGTICLVFCEMKKKEVSAKLDKKNKTKCSFFSDQFCDNSNCRYH